MEEVMDYLVENTSGAINNAVHDLINAYLRLEEKLEDKERELEDLQNDYDMCQYLNVLQLILDVLGTFSLQVLLLFYVLILAKFLLF